MSIDIPARLHMFERGMSPDGISAAQWGWVKPRLCSWLYARQHMEVTQQMYRDYVRYLVAQCPVKETVNAR